MEEKEKGRVEKGERGGGRKIRRWRGREGGRKERGRQGGGREWE